jgi:hypothetical protein
MQKIEIGDGVSIELFFDGDGKRVIGNFVGIIWTPPEGGRSWLKVNGDCGDCATDEEALAELR